MTELEVLQRTIRTLMNKWHDALIEGDGVNDFAAYRYVCGVIHGLALAERELLDQEQRSRVED